MSIQSRLLVAEGRVLRLFSAGSLKLSTQFAIHLKFAIPQRIMQWNYKAYEQVYRGTLCKSLRKIFQRILAKGQ